MKNTSIIAISEEMEACMDTLQQDLFRVVVRHNRLYRLTELNAPEEWIQNELALIKESVLKYATDLKVTFD